jgi:hypothetical protein
MFIPISLLTQLGLLSSSTSFQLFLKKKCKKMSHNYLDTVYSGFGNDSEIGNFRLAYI